KEAARFDVPELPFGHLAISPDGRFATGATQRGWVYLWRLPPPTERSRQEAPEPEAKAFVVLGDQSIEVGKFDTLAEAVAHANRGDTIEIRGNGPFLIDRMELKNLTIRAGPGYAPVLKPSLALAKTDVSSLLEIKGPVTLEGLELHHEGPPGKPGSDSTSHDILGSESGPLYLANCKLVV